MLLGDMVELSSNMEGSFLHTGIFRSQEICEVICDLLSSSGLQKCGLHIEFGDRRLDGCHEIIFRHVNKWKNWKNYCEQKALIETFLEIFTVKKKEHKCSIDMKLRGGKCTSSEVLQQNIGNNKQMKPKKIITREIGILENKTMGNSVGNHKNISSRRNASESALCEMEPATLSSTTKNTSKYLCNVSTNSRVCSTNILRKSSSETNNNTNSSEPPQSFSTKKTAAQVVTPLIIDSTNIRSSLKSNKNTNCIDNHSLQPPQSLSTKKTAAPTVTPLTVDSTNIRSSLKSNNTNCLGNHSSQPPQSLSSKKSAAQSFTPLIVDTTNLRSSLKSNNNTNCNHSSQSPQSLSTKKKTTLAVTPLIVDGTNIRSSLRSNNITNCSDNHSSQPQSFSIKKTATQNVTPLIVDGTNIRTEKTMKKRKTRSVIDSIIDQGTESEIVEEVVSNPLDDTSQSKKRKRTSGDDISKDDTSQSKEGKHTVDDISKDDTSQSKKGKHTSVDDISKDAELEEGSVNTIQVDDDDDVCSVISVGSDEEVMIIDSASKPNLDVNSDIIILDTPCPKKKTPNPDADFIDLVTPAPVHKSSEFRKLKDKQNKQRRRKPYQNFKSTFKPYKSVLGNDAFQRNAIFTNTNGAYVPSTYVNSIPSGSTSCWFLTNSNPGVNNNYNQPHTQVPSSSVYGNNFYNPNPNSVRTGLRPVVIDGSNVAMGHTNGRIFSSLGLKICIDYFVQRKHKVIAFVPQFRKGCCTDLKMLDDLEKKGYVTFTPSRKIQNRLVVPYDDRFIVQYAAECGGVIVSTDNYRDLLSENPSWRETIENRLLMFTWVGDMLMFPQDPLGWKGPNLERFLQFP